jgi:hypothetical protein
MPYHAQSSLQGKARHQESPMRLARLALGLCIVMSLVCVVHLEGVHGDTLTVPYTTDFGLVLSAGGGTFTVTENFLESISFWATQNGPAGDVFRAVIMETEADGTPNPAAVLWESGDIPEPIGATTFTPLQITPNLVIAPGALLFIAIDTGYFTTVEPGEVGFAINEHDANQQGQVWAFVHPLYSLDPDQRLYSFPTYDFAMTLVTSSRPTAVPEPASLVLVASGLLGIIAGARAGLPRNRPGHSRNARESPLTTFPPTALTW